MPSTRQSAPAAPPPPPPTAPSPPSADAVERAAAALTLLSACVGVPGFVSALHHHDAAGGGVLEVLLTLLETWAAVGSSTGSGIGCVAPPPQALGAGVVVVQAFLSAPQPQQQADVAAPAAQYAADGPRVHWRCYCNLECTTNTADTSSCSCGISSSRSASRRRSECARSPAALCSSPLRSFVPLSLLSLLHLVIVVEKEEREEVVVVVERCGRMSRSARSRSSQPHSARSLLPPPPPPLPQLLRLPVLTCRPRRWRSASSSSRHSPLRCVFSPPPPPLVVVELVTRRLCLGSRWLLLLLRVYKPSPPPRMHQQRCSSVPARSLH